MKKLTLSLLLLGIVPALNIHAQTENSFPTVWHIINGSSTKVYLQCISPPPKGLDSALRMSASIDADSSEQYSWGDWFYNDGLGLNPGNFTCAAGEHAQPLQRAGKHTTLIQTEWGEAVTLSIQKLGGDYLIRKIPSLH